MVIFAWVFGCSQASNPPDLGSCGNGKVDAGEVCDPSVLWDVDACDPRFEACMQCMPDCRAKQAVVPDLVPGGMPLLKLRHSGLPMPAACTAEYHSGEEAGIRYTTTYKDGVVMESVGTRGSSELFKTTTSVDTAGRPLSWSGSQTRGPNPRRVVVRDVKLGRERNEILVEGEKAYEMRRWVVDAQGRVVVRIEATFDLELDAALADPDAAVERARKEGTLEEMQVVRTGGRWERVEVKWENGVAGDEVRTALIQHASGTGFTPLKRRAMQERVDGALVDAHFEYGFHPDGSLASRSLMLATGTEKWVERFDADGAPTEVVRWGNVIATHTPTRDGEGRPVRAELGRGYVITAQYAGDVDVFTLEGPGGPKEAKVERKPDGTVVTTVPSRMSSVTVTQNASGAVVAIEKQAMGRVATERFGPTGASLGTTQVNAGSGEVENETKAPVSEHGLPATIRDFFSKELKYSLERDELGRITKVTRPSGELAATFDYGCLSSWDSSPPSTAHEGVQVDPQQTPPEPPDPYGALVTLGFANIHLGVQMEERSASQ